jgi:L-rhamnose-H+ transport protein
MTESVSLGTALVLLGAVMQGAFALPMKRVRRWTWENLWLIYSVVGLLLVPALTALMTVPELSLVLQSVPAPVILKTALFGFAWGVGNVLFGLAVAEAGMSISFAIVSGMSASLGSIIPLIVLNRERLVQPSGIMIMIGVAMALGGVGIIGMAGRRREMMKGLAGGAPTSPTRGIILAVTAGLFGPMLNFSIAFGKNIVDEAVKRGATPTSGRDAIWLVCLAGGFVSNGGYAVLKLVRQGTWRRFGEMAPLRMDLLLAALMGVLFTGGLLFYGRGAAALGGLGLAVGWPVFQCTMIITSSCLGALSGEWRGADSHFLKATVAGLAILLTAITILSVGNRL